MHDEPDNEPALRMGAGTPTILLVDDSGKIRSLLRTLLANLASLGVVGEAADGKHAIELASELQPDVVVLDLQLPILDGLDALPAIRAAAPAARVVVYTAAPVLAERARALGAFDVVSKGKNAMLVVAAVRDALSRPRPQARLASCSSGAEGARRP